MGILRFETARKNGQKITSAPQSHVDGSKATSSANDELGCIPPIDSPSYEPGSQGGEEPWLLSASDVAALLAVNKRTIWRWDSAGVLPAPVRISGTTRWKRADVEEWVRAGCPPQQQEK
ncbi:MAG: helix-turn-helix domain-containing protein [Fuerstiella sp.]